MITGVSQRIDGGRLWQRLMELAKFGATSKGGVCRLALSKEEVQARAALVAWAKSIGLRPSVDAAANLFLALEGREPQLPPLLIGSHIDSQPTGGKFDGAYGVLAGFEAVHAISEHTNRPRRTIEVVAWMNEEGSRFAPGMMGSAVFTGKRTLADILPIKDRAGSTVESALRVVLDAERDIPRRPMGFPIAGFLEAHIEQGTTPQAQGCTAGVVTGIQGKRTFRVDIIGEESHAGTTPRRTRRDALTSELCRREGIAEGLYYSWSRETCCAGGVNPATA
jgi:N-carbamoyl-L-amino-acid hydrolase